MPLVLPGEEVSLNEPGTTFCRHHHLCSYAALLVSGSCEEAGDSGRFNAGPGDVLLHQAFEGHADRIGCRGALFINIHLTRPVAASFGKVADVDAVARAYERDPSAGAEAFYEQFRSVPHVPKDWPDLLAQTLAADPSVRLDSWGRSNGLHPASLSRGFCLAYGVAPQRYRHEQIAAKAARRILGSADTLAAVATDCGFADQAHMTRSLVALFGTTPAKLRSS